MNIYNNTVLITGGGSGIGLEIAKQFDELGNTVIIVGRDKQKLIQALSQLKQGVAISADLTNATDLNRLVTIISKDFPSLNILINNAGIAYGYSLTAATNAAEHAMEEMNTNFISAVTITEKLLPMLSKQPAAAIINNTSITAIVPALMMPTYSASKAALHSYTQALRLALQETRIKVFELMPPLVDTDLSKRLTAEKMKPSEVALELIYALQQDIYELHPGKTASIHKLFLSSPVEALKQLNGII